MDTSLIGKTVGKYRIVEHVGRGGMAEVFKAYQASLDRYVAIKLMHSFLAEDPEFFGRFSREAKNVAALHHAHIIDIYDFDHEGPMYYMVMEFIDGPTLKSRLEELAARGERLPLDEVIRIIKDVGSALSYAHKRDMIHRDIKPANVMLDSSGRVILTDFGVAKMISGTKFTASGAMLGTPSYMAPELGLGGTGDARVDIYALGVMFYQLVTGRLPYEADTPIAVILKHVNDPLPLPRTFNPDLSASVENIIVKAMAKDPVERYQSIDEMLAHLNNLPTAELIELPTMTTLRGRIGDATMRAMPDARSGGTVVGARAPAAPARPAPAAKTGSLLIPLIIGGLALLLIAGVAGAILLGRNLAAAVRPTNTPTPIPTNTFPPPTFVQIGSPTFDPLIVAITEQAATIAALQTTPTASPTPDLTATFVACTFDSTVTKQDPKDGSSLPIGKATTVTLEIQNTGNCAWDDTTIFAFESGDSIHDAAQAKVQMAAAKPGEAVSVAIKLEPEKSQTYSSTWMVRLANGRDVGKPIVLTYKGAVAATLPPRATAVPIPTATSAASATPSGGPITGANPTFFSCTYIQNTTDYQCLTNIGVGGGVPPFTITIDGLAEMTGQQTPDKPYFFQLRGRRCIDRIFTFRVVDSAGHVFDGSGTFYPKTSKLFNNNTEVCGEG